MVFFSRFGNGNIQPVFSKQADSEQQEVEILKYQSLFLVTIILLFPLFVPTVI
jgi:hypothetical protein